MLGSYSGKNKIFPDKEKGFNRTRRGRSEADLASSSPVKQQGGRHE